MSKESAQEYAQGLAETLRDNPPDDMFDWLEGILDYQLTYSSQRDLISVRVLVAFGGPNAWIVFDGDHATVQAAWYSDMVEVFVPDVPLSAMVLEYFEEVSLDRR
jgi:hypothetical protein